MAWRRCPFRWAHMASRKQRCTILLERYILRMKDSLPLLLILGKARKYKEKNKSNIVQPKICAERPRQRSGPSFWYGGGARVCEKVRRVRGCYGENFFISSTLRNTSLMGMSCRLMLPLEIKPRAISLRSRARTGHGNHMSYSNRSNIGIDSAAVNLSLGEDP